MENVILKGRYAEFYQDMEISPNSDIPVAPGVYYPRNSRKSPISRRLRQKPSRYKERAVYKNGLINIDKPINQMFRISDWFIIMVEARWRWTLLSFIMAYFADWFFFGFIYWVIALTHEDLTEDHLYPNQNLTHWIPCVENIYGYTSCLLFSVEVHTTVAYGKRSITLECPQAILAMCLQCILSSIFQAFTVGILFAKLTRPKSRSQTILFSKSAVINLRNEKMCLVFRVGDMRKSRILNIKASAFIIRMQNSIEFLEDFEQIELKTDIDGCESTFFLWPVSVIHVIDEKSPLYRVSAADLICGRLEILAVFEGTIESTGQPVQARSSFAEIDILWGHRFIPMINFDVNKQVYDVDFSKLGDTEQVDTPLCSAAEYDHVLSSIECFENTDNEEGAD